MRLFRIIGNSVPQAKSKFGGHRGRGHVRTPPMSLCHYHYSSEIRMFAEPTDSTHFELYSSNRFLNRSIFSADENPASSVLFWPTNDSTDVPTIRLTCFPKRLDVSIFQMATQSNSLSFCDAKVRVHLHSLGSHRHSTITESESSGGRLRLALAFARSTLQRRFTKSWPSRKSSRESKDFSKSRSGMCV